MKTSPLFFTRWRLLAAFALALPMAAQAQPLPDWTSVHAGITLPQMAADGAGAAWVAGSVADGTIRVAKVGPSGATLLQRSLAVPGTQLRSTGVSVDAAGNAVVTGYRYDSVAVATQGPVVARFDANGNLLWQDAPAVAPATGITYQSLSDAAGNTYVTGSRVLKSAAGVVTQDVTLTKYSPQGATQWVRTWGVNVAGVEGMALTPAGQIVVAGWASATGDSRVAAFDAAGNQLWSTPLASSQVPGVAVAANGDIAVVGNLGLDFLVARFNPSFGPLWVRSYPARGYAIRAAFDVQGNLVVSGASNISTGFQITYAWLTIKLDAAGNPLWTHTYGSGAFGGDTPNGLALGGDGSVYLTGLGHAPLSTGGTAASTVTIKLTGAGAQAWLANTTATSTGVALKTTADGGVLVLGDNPIFVFTNTPPLAQLYRYAQTGLPNQAPVAMASASPSAGPAPLTVQFSSAGSTDADGRIASYAWDFGDGQGSTAANPSHAYAAGNYTARLTVTDTLGAASAAAPVVVSANVVVAPAKPTAWTLSSPSVPGGTSVTARVTVSSAAGVTLRLSSSNTSAASVPATVVVPAGATSATFTVRTYRVKRDTKVTLGATGNGVKASTALTVRR